MPSVREGLSRATASKQTRGARTVVLSFPNHVEDQVVLQQVAATHAVVKVDSSARAIEADVVRECCHLSLSLKIARNLLLEVTNLVKKIALKYVSLWMVPIPSVRA